MAHTPRVALSQSDLLRHLDEQIGFLEGSADAYDRGFDGEAKRLATTIRVLAHDTPKSRSLLGMLGRKNGTFVSTSIELDPNNRLTHGGLVAMAVGGAAGGTYLAQLDDVPFKRNMSFDDWWNEPVFLDNQRRELTRKQVILTAANQDGGAHVDPALDGVYADLSKNNSLGWVVSDGYATRPMSPPERACIRQIAHEVLASIKPGYSKQPEYGDVGVIAMGASLVEAGGPTVSSVSLAVPPFGKVRRNAPCPCGSGLKFKKCHGGLV